MISPNDPTANACKIVDFHGEKIASFNIHNKTMLCLPQERVKIIIIITIVIIYMYIFLIFTKILEIKRNLLSVLLRPKCFYVQKATLKPGFTGCVQLYTVHEMG